jgi:hypothetical protein
MIPRDITRNLGIKPIFALYDDSFSKKYLKGMRTRNRAKMGFMPKFLVISLGIIAAHAKPAPDA